MLEADTKTTNYLMQRDNKPSTRGSKHASSYLKLAGTSARTRQRRIIDWLGMLRFPHASSNLPPTRCKQTHFHEFQFYMSEAFGQQNNSWVQLGRRHQTEIHYPTGMQTTTFERTMLETPTSYESECRSPRQTGFWWHSNDGLSPGDQSLPHPRLRIPWRHPRPLQKLACTRDPTWWKKILRHGRR